MSNQILDGVKLHIISLDDVIRCSSIPDFLDVYVFCWMLSTNNTIPWNPMINSWNWWLIRDKDFIRIDVEEDWHFDSYWMISSHGSYSEIAAWRLTIRMSGSGWRYLIIIEMSTFSVLRNVIGQWIPLDWRRTIANFLPSFCSVFATIMYGVRRMK